LINFDKRKVNKHICDKTQQVYVYLGHYALKLQYSKYTGLPVQYTKSAM